MTPIRAHFVRLPLAFRGAKAEDRNMKRFSLGSVIVASVGLFALLTTAESVHAQREPEPSRNPVIFKDQLLQFTLLTRKNLRDIQALPHDDSVPIDPQLRYNLSQAYMLIRAAQWGMGAAVRDQTYKDPTLILAQERAEEAWNLARWPVDHTRVPRAEYISTSVQDLSRSLRLVQQALMMLP
jgi:hypothetical protein